MADEVLVGEDDFDPAAEYDRLQDSGAGTGAIATFTGLVRDSGDLSGVTGLYLEHYPGMTEKALQTIDTEAQARWPLEATLIIHRYGRLEPGDQIVLVATASGHREAAFEACHFLIDWLKTKAPFWKLEDSSSGGQWVDARDSDDAAAERWVHAGHKSSKAAE